MERNTKTLAERICLGQADAAQAKEGCGGTDGSSYPKEGAEEGMVDATTALDRHADGGAKIIH